LLLYLPFAVGRGELDGDGAEVHHLEHVLGLAVHLQDVLFEGGHVGYVVVPPLTLLLLQLNGDTAHRGALQAFHQVGDESANLREKNQVFFCFEDEIQQWLAIPRLSWLPHLIAKRLGRDESNLLKDPLKQNQINRFFKV
jgi:hypothetical protein